MKVIKKQMNSKMCLICGMKNPGGVQAAFYEMENRMLVSLFSFKEIHQSYPGRVHGGMIAAMLDELAHRAFWVYEPEKLAVTTSLSVKYRKPVPYHVPLLGIGEITKKSDRFFEATCRICLQDGTVLATSDVRYLILPPEKITEASFHEEMSDYIEDDVREILLPCA